MDTLPPHNRHHREACFLLVEPGCMQGSADSTKLRRGSGVFHRKVKAAVEGISPAAAFEILPCASARRPLHLALAQNMKMKMFYALLTELPDI